MLYGLISSLGKRDNMGKLVESAKSRVWMLWTIPKPFPSLSLPLFCKLLATLPILCNFLEDGYPPHEPRHQRRIVLQVPYPIPKRSTLVLINANTAAICGGLLEDGRLLSNASEVSLSAVLELRPMLGGRDYWEW